MALRLKLFLGIITFFAVTLSFFGYVAYDAAKESMTKRELILLESFATSLTSPLLAGQTEVSEEKLGEALRSLYLPSSQLSVLAFSKGNRQIGAAGSPIFPAELATDLGRREGGGSIVMNETTYIWYSFRIPQTDFVLCFIHRISPGADRVFFRSLTVPLIFTAIIVLWTAIWCAIFVASLLTRLGKQRDKLEHQAMHDPLTSLPNRALMQDRLQTAIHVAHREKTTLALLLIDLNRFKEINDTLGHHYGDRLLVVIAQRLQATVRRSDTVARLGGDEFAVILRNVDEAGACLVADKLAQEIERIVEVDNNKMLVSASIGVALYPLHTETTGTLAQYADLAMYAAKKGGTHMVVYSPQLEQYSQEKLLLSNDLRNAIINNQLELVYLPKFEIGTMQVIGVEALLRWKHPGFGYVVPETLVAVAERAGFIRSLTEYVLNKAFREFATLTHKDITLAVNLSIANLQDVNLASSLMAAAKAHDLAPERIMVEITERALMANPTTAMECLLHIAEMGFSLSIDDFGTGYFSLVHVKRLPIQEIKIDRAFVGKMLSDEEDAVIVRTVLNLGHSLGKKIVAEGVDAAATLDVLKQWGCDIAQGYFLCQPLTIAELDTMLYKYRHYPAVQAIAPALC